jgi:type II secretory pathway pseudopilin PulG
MKKISFLLKHKNKKQAGSTFIEVLVAMVVVATVLTALGSMMALSMRVAEANEMEQLAQLKAQQVLEFFRKERLVGGWNTFYSSLNDGDYCLSPLPSSINNIGVAPCPTPLTVLNHFYYKIETSVTKDSTAGAESIELEVNVYRYTKGGTLLGNGAFFTLRQVFKQY